MKSMKKSMVVTTVLMVVLLIVALSTATFAWYTAQNTATISETNLLAADSNSASLVVDGMVADGSYDNTSVSITLSQTSVQPMELNAKPDENTTLTDFTFSTYTVNSSNKYVTTPTSATPAKIATVTGRNSNTDGDVYVTNTGKSATVTVTVNIYEYFKEVENVTTTTKVDTYYVIDSAATARANKYVPVTSNANYYTVSGSDKVAKDGVTYYEKKANDWMRVAIFACDSASTEYKYVGTFANTGANSQVQFHDYDSMNVTTDDTAPAYLTDTNDSSKDNHFAATACGTPVNIAVVPNYGALKVQAVVWFEGVGLKNADAMTGAAFVVTFGAV